MTREIAYQLLTKHLTNPALLKHSLAVEAAMRALSLKFHGDTEEWGITGLLHDADYEKSRGNPNKHGFLLFELEPNSIPTVVEHAIKAHNFEFTKVAPVSPMDWALYCSDQLSGLIVELALMSKEKKLASVIPSHITEKLKDAKFVKKTNIQSMTLTDEKLGIPLQEFINITLKAIQGIHEDLEL